MNTQFYSPRKVIKLDLDQIPDNPAAYKFKSHICAWCEEDDYNKISEHTIKNTRNQEVKEILCSDCFDMYDQQMADALDDFICRNGE